MSTYLKIISLVSPFLAIQTEATQITIDYNAAYDAKISWEWKQEEARFFSSSDILICFTESLNKLVRRIING